MEKEKITESMHLPKPTPLSPNTIEKYIIVRNNLPTPISTPIHSPTCSGMFLTHSL